jgi:hypothetical protein
VTRHETFVKETISYVIKDSQIVHMGDPFDKSVFYSSNLLFFGEKIS